MAQNDPRLVGNIYRIGQVMSSSTILTACTAYHRYTNDVVGLYVIGLPTSVQIPFVQQLLQPLTQRQGLHSSHVLQVHDFGIDGTRAYIATDPPRGVTLRYVLDTDNIDLQRSLELVRQLARGVQSLHEKQIHALDLRPHLLTVDTPGTVDRAQVDDIGLRTILIRLGYTYSQHSNDISYLDPRYAPPEYINHEESGPWSDTYQLGLLFFELVTGRPPFVGLNPAATGIMQSSEPVPRMSQYNHETPASFQDVIERALQKDPQRRYTSATQLLEALEQLQASLRPSRQQKIDSRQPGLTAEIPEVSIDDTHPAVPTNGAGGIVDNSGIDPSTQSEVYAYLCFEKDGAVLQRFPMTKPVCILGRIDPKRNLSPDIDLTELDPKMTISRQHARIRFEKTFFYIEDLKSRNKTRLGELPLLPLKAEILQHGDIIFVGKVRLRFEVPGMNQLYVFKERH
jgi:serine/threonine protein kinase